MAQYHPDKVSHLGEKFQTIAEEESKNINRAFEYFREEASRNEGVMWDFSAWSIGGLFTIAWCEESRRGGNKLDLHRGVDQRSNGQSACPISLSHQDCIFFLQLSEEANFRTIFQFLEALWWFDKQSLNHFIRLLLQNPIRLSQINFKFFLESNTKHCFCLRSNNSITW